MAVTAQGSHFVGPFLSLKENTALSTPPSHSRSCFAGCVIQRSLCSPGCPQTDVSEEDSHAAVIPSYTANSEKSTGCSGGCGLKIPEQSGRRLLLTTYPPLQASENILAAASTTAGSSTCLACQQVPAPGEEYCQPSPTARPLSLAIGWMAGGTPSHRLAGCPRVSQHK